MKLAEKIFTLRKEKHFSQEQLAEKINVSRPLNRSEPVRMILKELPMPKQQGS